MLTGLILVAVLCFGFISVGLAQTSYTWNVNGAGDYAVAGNWTPARTAPAANDILIVNGAVTAGPVTLQNVQTENIGEFHVINNVFCQLEASDTAKTITIAGGASEKDLEVGPGCTLKFFGNIGITMDLSATAKGVIEGDVIWHATAASILHRIRSGAADGLIFESGATAAMAPVTTGAQNGFGGTSGVANGVRFKAGATYYQGGLKDGTRNGGTGTNPFGLTAPSSLVVFEPGSYYVTWDSIPSISGRTYGYFIWRNQYAQTLGGGSQWTVQNDLIIRNSGATSQGNLNMTAQTGPILVMGNLIVESGAGVFNATPSPTSAVNWEIRGNVDIQDPALFTPPTSTNVTVVLGGSANQNVNFAGKALPNLRINNSAGVTLTGNVAVSGVLNLENGEVVTGSNTLTAADGAMAVVRTNGFVNGTLTRNINATVTGNRLFPVGTTGEYSPVDFNITVAGSGTGTLAVNATATDHPNVYNPAGSLDRYWTLTQSGLSGFTGTLVFTYLDADVTGTVTESTMIAGRYLTDWVEYPAIIDTVANTATVNGVTTLSDWTLGNSGALLSVTDWRVFE